MYPFLSLDRLNLLDMLRPTGETWSTPGVRCDDAKGRAGAGVEVEGGDCGWTREESIILIDCSEILGPDKFGVPGLDG
jgi:hypothetical protein